MVLAVEQRMCQHSKGRKGRKGRKESSNGSAVVRTWNDTVRLRDGTN